MTGSLFSTLWPIWGTRMNFGESVTVEIYAGNFWNKTGIQLVAGQRHIMSASGHWVDFFIRHGPDGDLSIAGTFACSRTNVDSREKTGSYLRARWIPIRQLHFASAHTASTSQRRQVN